MRLKDWAAKQGISYQTAWGWHKAGKMPVRTTVTATGTIFVEDSDMFVEKNRCTSGVPLRGRTKVK